MLVDISVIVPVLNEEESIEKLYTNIKYIIDKSKKSYEILFVDDGSIDKTFQIIKRIADQDNNVVAIKLRKNFGKSIALHTAFKYIKGKIIITMDGDLQDDPEEIPKFVEKIEEGYDMVIGWKYPRKDSITKIISSKIFNKLTSYLTHIYLHDFNCGFKAYKKALTDNISLYGGMHRYISVIASWNGYKITELKIKHHPRQYSKSKYGTSRLFEGLIDLITIKFVMNYGTRPSHIFSSIGFVFLIIGVIIGSYLIYLKYINGISIGGLPSLQISLFVITGMQLISLGLIAEIIIKNEMQRDKQETVTKKYIEYITERIQ